MAMIMTSARRSPVATNVGTHRLRMESILRRGATSKAEQGAGEAGRLLVRPGAVKGPRQTTTRLLRLRLPDADELTQVPRPRARRATTPAAMPPTVNTP